MNDLRGLLYQLARTLGDINALMKGKIGSRFFNKLMGRKLVSRAWMRGCGCLVAAIVVATALLLGWAVLWW